MEELRQRVEDIMKAQVELDTRLQAIEANRDEFMAMKHTNELLHMEIQDLKEDIELQYKTSTQIQKESFDTMNNVYKEVLGFKKENMSSQREWWVAMVGALGGGVTVTFILQWISNFW